MWHIGPLRNEARQNNETQRNAMQCNAKQTVTCDSFHLLQAYQSNANTKAKQTVTCGSFPPSTHKARQINAKRCIAMQSKPESRDTFPPSQPNQGNANTKEKQTVTCDRFPLVQGKATRSNAEQCHGNLNMWHASSFYKQSEAKSPEAKQITAFLGDLSSLCASNQSKAMQCKNIWYVTVSLPRTSLQERQNL